MTIKLLGQLDPQTTATLIALLQELPMGKDVSSYARGRKRLWLNGLGEPFLGSPPRLSPSFECQDIHRIISDLDIRYDFCLAHYSGDSAIGIKPHRDASYANPLAYGINLGQCRFTCNGETHHLTGGEIYSFNCKQLHSAEPAPHRWALNLWTAKAAWLAHI
jgi:hypothetical protein